MTRIFDLTEKEIKELLRDGKITATVMGIGYVGIHTAALFAKAGARVFGVDINKELVDSINACKLPFVEPKLAAIINEIIRDKKFFATINAKDAISESDIIIICVPTPLNKTKQPDYSFVISATNTIGEYLQRGSVVILESSVAPLTTENLVAKILEERSELKAGEDFGLANCPERGNPGEMVDTCTNYTRIVGGINTKSTEVASAIYESVINGDIIKVSNSCVSEFVKLMENIYLDVNIAFVNEMAILCEKIGIDIFEVLTAGRTKAGFLPNTTIDLYEPGIGVGGGCVPVNSYFLRELAEDRDISLELIETARRINDSMPLHAASQVITFLEENGLDAKDSKIVVLGLAYKANVKDIRNTPAIPFIHELKRHGCEMVGVDPLLSEEEISDLGAIPCKTLDDAAVEADCILLVTAHDGFKKITIIERDKNWGLANSIISIIDGVTNIVNEYGKIIV